ncbi:unnamed protein product [Caenorhabditis angaria]|uniref:Uncharacterized protein n=1 Tax=Caenorhabditis angaria TaxID=860376 RepID=A0A9P1IA14_9PELO|nr:unnamed protein product [Caenorhabditis angaria]
MPLQSSDGKYNFRCSKRHRTGARKLSIFEGTRMPIKKLIKILWLICKGLHDKQIMRESKSKAETIIKIRRLIKFFKFPQFVSSKSAFNLLMDAIITKHEEMKDE